MPHDPPPDTYPAFRSRRELVALALVLLVVIGLPLAVVASRRMQASGPARVVELTGRLPTADQGGWTPEIITVQRGEHVKLRISSEDVVHGFSVPKLGINVDWIEPGKVTEVEFVAERPGRYAFQCTVWCQAGHWRMRGTIEVIDPNDPVASARDVDPPADRLGVHRHRHRRRASGPVCANDAAGRCQRRAVLVQPFRPSAG